MKEDLDLIIKKLERVQELIHRGRAGEAATVVYEAQIAAIFIRDNKHIT